MRITKHEVEEFVRWYNDRKTGPRLEFYDREDLVRVIKLTGDEPDLFRIDVLKFTFTFTSDKSFTATHVRIVGRNEIVVYSKSPIRAVAIRSEEVVTLDLSRVIEFV